MAITLGGLQALRRSKQAEGAASGGRASEGERRASIPTPVRGSKLGKLRAGASDALQRRLGAKKGGFPLDREAKKDQGLR